MAQVVLQKTIAKVGRRGEVVTVADGYLRNYLYPRGLALPVTAGRLREAQERMKKMAVEMDQIRKNAGAVAETLTGLVVRVVGKATPKGRLYAAITTDELLRAVEEQAKIKLDPVILAHHDALKQVGRFEIPIKLTDDVGATLLVEVAAA